MAAHPGIPAAQPGLRVDFWSFLDRLVASSRVVVDRPRGSHHPRFPEVVYPLDYGYLEGTTSGDGAGIDVWLGASGQRRLSAVLLTVDLAKHDTEVKLLLGCSAEEHQIALDFFNSQFMQAILVDRPAPSKE
jgi:inorganic pyrophosphatase